MMKFDSVVYRKKGLVARFARWIHRHNKKRFWFNIGYGKVETDDTPSPVGIALNSAEKYQRVQVVTGGLYKADDKGQVNNVPE